VRLLWILVSGLSCAGLVLATSLGLAALSETPLAPAAREGRLAFTHELARTRGLLGLVCERDIQVERLLLELSAGAAELDASREAEALARVLGGDVLLLAERGPALTELGASGPGQGVRWSLPALEQARRTRSLLGTETPTLLDACLAERDQARLWIARSLPLHALLTAAQLSPDAFQLRPASGASAAPDEVARFPLLSDPGHAVRLSALTQSRNQDAALGFVVALAALALLLGAGLGFLSTRTRAADETVLTAIERAAERVARGDLSSQIGVRLGGRADQTFQTFDRMTAELRETRAKLAEAERAAAWQDMARRIAHEIKNPLSPIKVALETLRKAHTKRLPAFDEIFEESTRAMLEEVARMEHILREFSEFARLPKARPGALDLARLVQETTTLYAPSDVSVEVSTAPGELPVHADREQLTQVVVNLLANAVDAARSASAPRVQVGARRVVGQVELWVEDNGQGVPEPERERIFEPYVTSKSQGSGLGLSIARRIVLDHGGSIAVDSGALGGARFTVQLPAEVS
jgi:two-component system nitrogen regulation sensor histidine kinase NtrY